MLVRLSMENFKSFMKRNDLDLLATGYEILNEINKTEDNILKGALIVGGNATGKSTVLDAIKFLLELLVWQVNIYPLKYACLFNESEPKTLLEYEFLINNSTINYKLEILEGRIFKEIVDVNDKNILSRMGETAEYINSNGTIIELSNLQTNQSAIRKVYFDTKFIDNDILKLWFKFLEDSVYIDQSNKKVNKAIGNSSQLTYFDYFDKNGTDEFNKFLNEIDYNQNVVYTNQYKLDKVQFNRNEDRKDIIMKRKDFKDFGLPIQLESVGNETLINVVPFIIEAMQNNAMVIIDEFSSAFHNILEEKIIKYFMKNSKRAQLFLVSHSTNLLTNTLFRPDQIYTVDFIENIGSKLNRVSDSKPREAQNLEKMYLSGVFNGIPTFK